MGGRPRIDPSIRDEVLRIKAAHRDFGSAKVRRILEANAREQGTPLDKVPSERWVRGVLEGASDEELDMRSAARWPESFHQGVLPWSEAPALIEILAHGRLRPSHARVRWLSRVTAAAPGLEFRVRHRVAMALELWEAGRQEEPWEDLKTIEAVLAGTRDPVDLAEIKVGRFMNFGAASEWFGDPGQVAPSLPELGDVTSGFPITVDDNAVEAE